MHGFIISLPIRYQLSALGRHLVALSMSNADPSSDRSGASSPEQGLATTVDQIGHWNDSGAYMADEHSISIFTLEVDRKRVMTFASRRHADAEAICTSARIRTMLQSISSEGKPLCDSFAIYRVRLARSNERAAYSERASATALGAPFPIVFLVELDGPLNAGGLIEEEN